jgi:hypothetical protein
MTVLNVVLTQPRPDGTRTPAKGVLMFTPTQRHTVDDEVVLPVPFQAKLVDGAVDVELEPSTLAWVWRIDEHASGTASRTIYATIPDVGPVNYKDLVPLDPATLGPVEAPEPAWTAALTEVDERLSAGTIQPDPDDPGFFLIGA